MEEVMVSVGTAVLSVSKESAVATMHTEEGKVVGTRVLLVNKRTVAAVAVGRAAGRQVGAQPVRQIPW
jgi:hypothetical protein